jgi:hypothetical protein
MNLAVKSFQIFFHEIDCKKISNFFLQSISLKKIRNLFTAEFIENKFEKKIFSSKKNSPIFPGKSDMTFLGDLIITKRNFRRKKKMIKVTAPGHKIGNLNIRKKVKNKARHVAEVIFFQHSYSGKIGS